MTDALRRPKQHKAVRKEKRRAPKARIPRRAWNQKKSARLVGEASPLNTQISTLFSGREQPSPLFSNSIRDIQAHMFLLNRRAILFL